MSVATPSFFCAAVMTLWAATFAAALTEARALVTASAVTAAVASSTAASVAASTAKSTNLRKPGRFCKNARWSACLISLDDDLASTTVGVGRAAVGGDTTPNVGDKSDAGSIDPNARRCDVDFITDVGSTRVCGCA